MANVYSIEEAVRNWLVGMGYNAYVRVPKDRPQRFVTVERTGGGVENMVDYPLIAVQTWAQTQAEAEEDAAAIRMVALVGNLPVGVHSMRVNSGPYKFYDEDSGQPRYQVVFDVACQLVN